MGAKQIKLLTVASNGQISIGKAWAGRQIVLEEVNDGEIHIKSGTFVPDSQKVFNSKEAQASLDEFNKWEEKASSKPTPAAEVLAKLKKQKSARGK
jgi:hypothetical protein